MAVVGAPPTRGTGSAQQQRTRPEPQGNGLAMGLTTLFSLERPQEIDEFLLLLNGQPIEMFDDLVCFAAVALVIADGLH
jgi:hypothetical protein